MLDGWSDVNKHSSYGKPKVLQYSKGMWYLRSSLRTLYKNWIIDGQCYLLENL